MKAAVEWLQLFVVALGVSVVFAGWLLGYQETIMINVFFEDGRGAEYICSFETEEEYALELPELEQKAAACRMYVTESVD